MKRLAATIAGLGALIGLQTIPAAFAAKPANNEMKFKVLLDDKEIGYHSFKILDEGDTTTISINAEFDVKVLFINAYSYRHENTETWQSGCLRAIESSTNSNGKRFQVSGESVNGAFELATLGTSQSLKQDCVMTFAYWDQSFLSQSRLLNAQTGDYIEVQTRPLGKRSFDVDGSAVAADGFGILSDDGKLNIKVWYLEKNKRWIALESHIDNNKILRYVPAAGMAVSSTTKMLSNARDAS